MEPAYKVVDGETNASYPDVKAPASISGWPTDPRPIPSQPLWIVVDFLLLLMPIAFIGQSTETGPLRLSLTLGLALATLAYQLDGHEPSNRGQSIRDATLVAPTLFPLAFAALGGRSIKRIALWRAERGTTLGFLEHMIGSQSLVGTVGHAFALRSFNLLTIFLLVLWALSPLGGQSALRLVHETNSTISSSRSVFYSSVDASSEFINAGAEGEEFNRANAVLAASLMTADNLENSTSDTWNHPKIPRLEALEQAEEKKETTRDWYMVNSAANYPYASLTGINVINLSETGITNFSVPYEYMYFGCDLSPYNNLTFGRQFPDRSTQLKYLNGLSDTNVLESGGKFRTNATLLSSSVNNFGNTMMDHRSFFIYTRTGDTTETKMIPQALIYGSNSVITLDFWLFECSMKSVIVEANIICDKAVCGVERLRRLDIPRSARSTQHLPYDVVHNGYTNRHLIKYLTRVGGEDFMKNNPVDAYIYGNGAWEVNEYRIRPDKRWETFINNTEKTKQMSQRMTRFLNTFYDASRWPMAMTRNDPFARISLNKTIGLPPAVLTMNTTQATVSEQIPIYRADPGWVACLVLCSSVLLLLGLYSFFLSLCITAPDIFDYVSSFTRDSPYVKLTAGGSTLDGAERARLLRKLPVQLGDADVDGETGYITIRRVDGKKDCELGQIRKDRMYR